MAVDSLNKLVDIPTIFEEIFPGGLSLLISKPTIYSEYVITDHIAKDSHLYYEDIYTTMKDNLHIYAKKHNIYIDRLIVFFGLDIFPIIYYMLQARWGVGNVLKRAVKNGYYGLVQYILQSIDPRKLLNQLDKSAYYKVEDYKREKLRIREELYIYENCCYFVMEKASRRGYKYMVYFILDLNLNHRIKHFNKSMILAAKYGHIDIIHLMLKHGATEYDETMDNAAIGGHVNIIKLMIKRGATKFDESIIHATSAGHVHVVQFLLTNYNTYKNWNSKDIDYTKMLYVAIENEHTKIITLMLDLNLITLSQVKNYVIKHNHPHIIQLIVDSQQ